MTRPRLQPRADRAARQPKAAKAAKVTTVEPLLPGDFAAALRERLAAEGLTASDLARHVALSSSAVSLYLHGRLPSPATAERIRAALPGLDVPDRDRGRPRHAPRRWPVAVDASDAG